MTVRSITCNTVPLLISEVLLLVWGRSVIKALNPSYCKAASYAATLFNNTHLVSERTEVKDLETKTKLDLACTWYLHQSLRRYRQVMSMKTRCEKLYSVLLEILHLGSHIARSIFSCNRMLSHLFGSILKIIWLSYLLYDYGKTLINSENAWFVIWTEPVYVLYSIDLHQMRFLRLTQF